MRVNWSLVISAISLVLSVYAAFSVWYQSHRKVRIKCNWICVVSDQRDFSFNFYNPASEGIVINGVSFKADADKEIYKCVQWPIVLLIRSNKRIFSDNFPVNIPAKTSKNVICVSQHLPKDLSLDTCEFYIEVNGKQITLSVDLKDKVINSDKLVNVLESNFG